MDAPIGDALAWNPAPRLRGDRLRRDDWSLGGQGPPIPHARDRHDARHKRLRTCLTFRDSRPYGSTMDYEKYITIEPGKRGGKPCIRGLRITVYDVLDYLASGMTEDEILRDFPDLSREDIRACLAFAADRERKLITIPA